MAFAAAAVVIGILVCGNFAADEESNIDQLLKRIHVLEKRVAELEKKQAAAVAPAQYAPVTPAQSMRPRLPNGWTSKSINGVPYYIVPLRGNEGTVEKDEK
jgi:hypothetical protein